MPVRIRLAFPSDAQEFLAAIVQRLYYPGYSYCSIVPKLLYPGNYYFLVSTRTQRAFPSRCLVRTTRAADVFWNEEYPGTVIPTFTPGTPGTSTSPKVLGIPSRYGAGVQGVSPRNKAALLQQVPFLSNFFVQFRGAGAPGTQGTRVPGVGTRVSPQAPSLGEISDQLCTWARGAQGHWVQRSTGTRVPTPGRVPWVMKY